MINIDIVCPVYKDSSTLEDLVKSFYTQQNIKINKIVFPFTLSHTDEDDIIREIIKKYHITSFEIEKENFSHSLTREKAIKEYCESPIIVMISQDIVLTNENVFYNLVSSIDAHESVYNFARQISKYKSIEKYIRQKNYPTESYFVSKEDVEKMQFMAYFASDACSAYDREVFIKLGGYQGFDIMMSEDALYSKVVLDAGYKKKYCADAVVEHSHKYTLKQLYKRYYDTGVFESQVKLFDDIKLESSGKSLAFYVLGQALKHFNIPVLFRWLPDMTSRYLGHKKGRKAGLKK
jgi:rhamnosyltransferase